MSKHQMCLFTLLFLLFVVSSSSFPTPPRRRNISENIWWLEAHTVDPRADLYLLSGANARFSALSWTLSRSFQKYFSGKERRRGTLLSLERRDSWPLATLGDNRATPLLSPAPHHALSRSSVSATGFPRDLPWPHFCSAWERSSHSGRVGGG